MKYMKFENLNPYRKAGDLETRVTLLNDGYELDYPDPVEFNKLLEPIAGKTILDVGCGIGVSLLPFGPQLRDTPNMIGLDSSRAVLERAQELQKQQNLPPLNLIHGDIQNLPFLDHQFHLILARHMLYHVSNIPRAVREIARALKPEGLFMATTNSAYSRPELTGIHKDALSQFPNANFIERGSARFGLENGEKILKQSFSYVETIPWHGHIRYKNLGYALKYYTSTVYYQHAFSDQIQREQLGAKVSSAIESVIAKSGRFEVTSWGAIFLAHR